MKSKDRPITHYFGQSPRSDESASSLKENEEDNTPPREKSGVNKASPSDILKCKISGNNFNTEEELLERSKCDFIDKTIKTKQSGKKRSVSKKKSFVSDDEDFNVKSIPKPTKTRGKPRKKVQAETSLLDIEPLQSSSKNENESSISSTSRATAICTLDQSSVSQKETTVVSPIPDDSVSGSKLKSAKNILHFFSPTKCIETQPEPSMVEDVGKELCNESSTAACQGESLTEFKQEKKPIKKSAVKKTRKKFKADLEACDSANNSKESTEKKVDVKQKQVSLPKATNGNAKDEKQLVSPPSKDGYNFKSSMSNAFQMLMSKKQDTHGPTDLNNDSIASEGFRSFIEKEDTSLDNTLIQFSRKKKRNRIESGSEDDDQSSASGIKKKLAAGVDETDNQEESGKKNLMKYFQKISKAEAEIQSQKVQFKVEALVHHSDGSPYKTKYRKDSQTKNLQKKRAQHISNDNEIEWLGSEEITVEDNPAPKSEEAVVGPSEFDQAENKCQKRETKSAEKLVQTKTKKSLKLSKSSSSPRPKQIKKASKTSENETSCTVIPEAPSQLSETPVLNIPPADDKDLSQSSPPCINKTSEKKLKQVSLDSSFLLKSCSNGTATISFGSTPVVLLPRLSHSDLSAKVQTPLKPKRKKKSKTNNTVQVEVSGKEDPLTPLPQESLMKSPPSPKQSASDNSTPQARTWKMRVCLTPKTETNQTNSLLDSPITIDTGSDDDFDVQEIAVVKKKKVKKGNSTDSGTKKLLTKEVEIVYEEKDSNSNPKAAVKLAPLFMRPKKPDRISEQAKLEFLQSGLPEQVKKMIEVQKSMECAEVEIFPLISHVTQLGNNIPWTPSEGCLSLKTDPAESDPVPSESLKMGDMTTCDPVGCEMAEVLSNCSTTPHRQKRRIATKHVPTVLSIIRAENNSFEVIQAFKMLREKYRRVLEPDTSASEMSKSKKRSRSSRRSKGSNKGMDSPKPKQNISNLMWTDKYRPTTSDAIIGNRESVQRLKHWLESLRKTSQSAHVPVLKPKKRKKNDYEDDFALSDENCDSNSSSSCISNSALLLGCHGSGKTNCVYALAADLGYKVLEINASERRSGKIILANLSEATQSHQVVNHSHEQSSAATNFFSPKNSKPKASKRKIEKRHETEEESNQNKHSLILIKDIDVVFEEEDEGFVPAVASLVSTSKRPVIFTTTVKDFPHLNRVINSSTLLLEFVPDKTALCSWLQTIALVEGVYVSRNALSDLMSSCRDDVRQCLLQLQVWMATGGNDLFGPMAARDNDSIKVQEKILLDEFLESDITEEDLDADVNKSSLTDFEHHDCIGALQGRNDIELGKDKRPVTIPLPLKLGCVWWNVPKYLSLPEVQVSKLVLPEAPEQPRRFKGLFDDSLFDVTSDDEDTLNSQPISSQPTNSQPASSQAKDSAEESIPPFENGSESINNDSIAIIVERCTQQELDAMLSHLQAMSTCDLISTTANLPENADDFEPTPRYWQASPRDSLSQSVPKKEGPNLLIEDISRSICHWLAEKSIEHARTVLLEDPQPGRFDALLPDQQIERRRLDVKDAEIKVLEIVATCAQLDRSAIALDYLPTLRRICSSEQRRAEINTSRRNRFYHYFKGLSLHLTPDQTIILSST